MKRILICVAILTNIYSYCQNITADRRTDWGTDFFEVATDTTINILDYGALNDGTTNCLPAYAQILTDFPTERITIYFPTGTYLFNGPISLRSNMILAGADSDSTLLKFDGGGSNSFIQVYGGLTGAEIPLVSHYNKDELYVVASDASSLQPGDYIKILEDDAGRIASAWATNLLGQIVLVDTIIGNEIHFSDPLRMNFDSINNPRFFEIDMITHVGIECLAIERLDATVAQTKNIDFSKASYCYVNGVKSNFTNFGHVVMSNSYNVHVTNSYFQDAFSYGGGGEGYGVVLQLTSGNCLVQNNIFKHLRHSILLQACVNGNMVAYNYSIEPYWSSFPSNTAGDIVLHGNYVFMNLIEGNTVQNIVIDDSHGLNGPYNTFYRNRAELYGLNMAAAFDNQNFVGNEISNLIIGFYILQGIGHYEYGNNDGGTTIPAGTSSMLDTSMFLISENPYWGLINILPQIGYPNVLNEYKILAQLNYEAGIFANCNQQFVDTTTQDTVTANIGIVHDEKLWMYPNPTSEWVYFNHLESNESVEIFNSAGALCFKGIYQNGVDLRALSAGIYFVKVHYNYYRLIKI